MPYFVCFKRSNGQYVIKGVADNFRMHEAVDLAVKGEYIDGNVDVYQTKVCTTINMKDRVNFSVSR